MASSGTSSGETSNTDSHITIWNPRLVKLRFVFSFYCLLSSLLSIIAAITAGAVAVIDTSTSLALLFSLFISPNFVLFCCYCFCFSWCSCCCYCCCCCGFCCCYRWSCYCCCFWWWLLLQVVVARDHCGSSPGLHLGAKSSRLQSQQRPLARAGGWEFPISALANHLYSSQATGVMATALPGVPAQGGVKRKALQAILPPLA